MGSTSQKLTYLNETKELIKDGINAIGGDIDASVPFRNYSEKLDTIYEKLPKVSGIGETLSLTPTIKGKMKVDLKGNTLQNGTPTPETPVEVEVVSGDNTIKVANGDNTEYEEYPISLGNIELCKIGNHQDKIYKDNGKWYLHKEIGKVVLDGSVEEASINTSKTNTTRIVYTNLLNYNTFQDYSLSLCNRLICKNVWNNDNEGFYFDDNSKTLIMRMNKTIIGETISSLNTYLSANNLIFVYTMTEPIDTEITDTTLLSQLEALAYSYEGTTNISQVNDDLAFVLNVSALKK